MVKKYRNWIALILMVIVAGSALSTLTVKKISCISGSQPCESSELELLSPLYDSSLFFSSSEQLLIDHHQSLPFRIARIEKRFFNHLVVHIQEAPAIYTISSNAENQQVIGISQDGNVVSVAENQQLPTIYLTDSNLMPSSTRINPELHSLVQQIIKNSPARTFPLEKIYFISSTNIIIHYQNLPPVIITQEVPEYALQHLENIMYTLETQQIDQPIIELDLRYRLPVLRTAI